MAQDHFERHNHYPGVVDWNFNVVFAGDRSVAAMAEAYKPLLTKPEFYEPIPTEWLHATILRVGKLEDYTEAEMLAVADKVQNRGKDLILPEFHFGDHMIIYGNVCFKIEPEAELRNCTLPSPSL